MKKIYLFILASSLLFSCQNSTDSGAKVIDETTAEEVKAEPVIVEPIVSSDDDEYTYYEFKGSLEGDIPLEIHLNVFGKLIQGELFYKKVGTPIRVMGEVGENNYWHISEYAADGNITGILSGNFKEQKDLTWVSPMNGKDRKMKLTIGEESKKTAANRIFKTDKIIGQYTYRYGKEGPIGNLVVKEAKGDSVYLDLICLTGAPGRNMATLEEATLAVKDDKISVSFGGPGEEYRNCAFDIKFYKDFVWIHYVDDRMECEFGYNASVVGIFNRVE